MFALLRCAWVELVVPGRSWVCWSILAIRESWIVGGCVLQGGSRELRGCVIPLGIGVSVGVGVGGRGSEGVSMGGWILG